MRVKTEGFLGDCGGGREGKWCWFEDDLEGLKEDLKGYKEYFCIQE